jgi:hypothetical protein
MIALLLSLQTLAHTLSLRGVGLSRRLAALGCVLAFGSVSLRAAASPADDIKASLGKAREGVIALLDTTDKAKQDSLVAQIGAASAGVDRALAAALTAPAAHAAEWKEFDQIWKAFKETRDGQLIPAVRAGKPDVAKSLAKGVQADRFKKMNELLATVAAK